MTITLTALQKQRRDTASNWTSNNTVLLAGEWGIESDTKKFKIGDGTTAWQSLAYVPIPDSNGAVSGNVNATGNVSAGGTLSATGNATVGGTFGVTGDATLSGNAIVQGDFTVNGTTTTVNTTNLDVEDKNITLNKVSSPSDTLADGGGITLKGSTDKTFNWVDSTDSWTSSEHITANSQKEVRYADADSSNYLGFKAPATVSANVVWTLPATDAAVNGYVLASDGSGNLSWVDAGSSTNPQITGDITLQNDGLIRGFSTLQATYTGSTKVLTVTVASKTANHRYNGSGSSNGYKINGYEAPFITLTAGRTYRFDQSDASNANHPLRFYLEADKTTAYTTGVTTNGTAGQAGAYTEISVTDTTPLILHYQCSSHAYMGNAVSTNSNVVNYNDLLNKPTIPTNNNQLTNGAGFIDGSALNASNLSSGTIPDARFPATLPAASGANLTNLPSQTDNNFTNADHSKLDGIEAGATADQTPTQIASALNGENVYTTANIGRDSNDYISFTDNTQMDIHINGNNEFRFEADGDFHADGNVVAYSTTISSDINLKDNIQVIPNALEKIDFLRGVTFDWKRDGKKSAGIIAQEVLKILPEAVQEVQGFKNTKKHLAVNYNALTSILIEAVKELKTEIYYLKNKK